MISQPLVIYRSDSVSIGVEKKTVRNTIVTIRAITHTYRRLPADRFGIDRHRPTYTVSSSGYYIVMTIELLPIGQGPPQTANNDNISLCNSAYIR